MEAASLLANLVVPVLPSDFLPLVASLDAVCVVYLHGSVVASEDVHALAALSQRWKGLPGFG